MMSSKLCTKALFYAPSYAPEKVGINKKYFHKKKGLK
jgi:hypothetical protein